MKKTNILNMAENRRNMPNWFEDKKMAVPLGTAQSDREECPLELSG